MQWIYFNPKISWSSSYTSHAASTFMKLNPCMHSVPSLSLSLPCQLPPQPKSQTVKTPWSNFNLCIYLYIQPLSPSCSPNVLADTAGNMKSSAACMSLVLVAWAIASGLFSRPVTAEGPCPGSFFSALVQLYPCMPAVAPFGPMPPSKPCCNVVKNLGQPCLCEIIKGPQITGVDRSVAMQLPSKCEANFQPCNLPALSYNYNDNFFFFYPIQALHNQGKLVIWLLIAYCFDIV